MKSLRNVPDDWNVYAGFCPFCKTATHASEYYNCNCLICEACGDRIEEPSDDPDLCVQCKQKREMMIEDIVDEMATVLESAALDHGFQESSEKQKAEGVDHLRKAVMAYLRDRFPKK
jgi:hypothetical protein